MFWMGFFFGWLFHHNLIDLIRAYIYIYVRCVQQKRHMYRLDSSKCHQSSLSRNVMRFLEKLTWSSTFTLTDFTSRSLLCTSFISEMREWKLNRNRRRRSRKNSKKDDTHTHTNAREKKKKIMKNQHQKLSDNYSKLWQHTIKLMKLSWKVERHSTTNK